MKCRNQIYCIMIFLLVVQASYAQKVLRERGFAGLGYRAVTQADADSMGLPDMRGVIVNRVVPNTPAQKAGFQIGDVLKKYDDQVILDNLQFVGVYQKYYAGDRIKITFIRGGKLKKTELVVAAFPKEQSDELDIEYTSFPTGDIYLRAVITSPQNSSKKKLPALLIVTALGSYRLIASPYYVLHRELAYEVAKAGFRVIRFEQRGFGDSEGEDFRTKDFETEVKDNLAAVDYLMNREDVDENSVFVFGHSTGGVVAALVASQRPLAGVIPSCTMGRTYFERIMETLRTQGELKGSSGEEIEKTIKKYISLIVPVSLGESLPEIIEKAPEATDLVNGNGRIMDDRNAAYWHQQLNVNLANTYSKITEPVLIVYGTSDFLTQLACHETIRDVLTASGNSDFTLEVIPNLDHAYALAKDMKESFENYKTYNFKKNPDVYENIVEWLKNHTIESDELK